MSRLSVTRPRAGRFKIFCPAQVFRKAANGDGAPSMGIAGIISSNKRDAQDEVVLQKGLDFTYFLGKNGTFNNEHMPGHQNILGLPTSVQQFKAGDTLPNGQLATRPCTYATGTLLNDPDGIKTYQKALALQEHGRGLAFSIEGNIVRRAGPKGDIIAKAEVRHVAICHEPVNSDAGMEVLVRSLRSARRQRKQGTKAMQVTGAAGEADNPLVRQDKERRITNLAGPPARPGDKQRRNKRKQQVAKKSRSTPNLVQSILAAFPYVGVEYAELLAATLDRQPTRTSQ